MANVIHHSSFILCRVAPRNAPAAAPEVVPVGVSGTGRAQANKTIKLYALRRAFVGNLARIVSLTPVAKTAKLISCVFAASR